MYSKAWLEGTEILKAEKCTKWLYGTVQLVSKEGTKCCMKIGNLHNNTEANS